MKKSPLVVVVGVGEGGRVGGWEINRHVMHCVTCTVCKGSQATEQFGRVYPNTYAPATVQKISIVAFVYVNYVA